MRREVAIGGEEVVQEGAVQEEAVQAKAEGPVSLSEEIGPFVRS